ncbi:HECT domain-containing protein, partial [Balamuthia mandrillaris]
MQQSNPRSEGMDLETPSSTGSSPQEIFRANVTRYFHQLTQGCGDPRCTNPYCASAGNKKSPNDAAALALSLARTQQHLCRTTTPTPAPSSTPTPTSTFTPKASATPAPTAMASDIPTLDLEEIRALVEEAKISSNYTPLIRLLGSRFSTPESLGFSFLLNGSPPTEETSNLNFEAIAEFYQLIQALPNSSVLNILMGAQERLLGNMKISAPRLVTAESLRPLFIVLENPLLMNPDYHKSILGPLFLCVGAMPAHSRDILVNWWKNFTVDHLRTVLVMVQQYITFRILQPPFIPSLQEDLYIPAATRVLSLLYAASEEGKTIPYNEFYNDLVNERMEIKDLKDDFSNWRNQTGFSFCDYPFVLNPDTKSKILQLESLVEQQLLRREAFRQTVFMNVLSAPALVFKIRRENLIQDSLSEISRHDPADLKKELRVHFVGEEAIDEGGVQKEFFQLILREIFDPKYGMFTYNEDTRVYWFNSNSTDFLEFELIGIILGLAIYNGVILDVHFPFIIYKKLCDDHTPTMDDLAGINPGLAHGLRKLLEYPGDDVEDVFAMNFQITYEVFGERKTYDLKPDGESIPVTNANREEYVNLYIEYLLKRSVERQFQSFIKGFQTVCMSPGFKLFRAEELELLICGSPVLDFEELEKVTSYDSGYHPDHPVIKNFWEIVHSFTLEQKKKLLFFSTGSDRAPIGGLGKLQFIIARHGNDDDRLPQAHTCFNHLL